MGSPSDSECGIGWSTLHFRTIKSCNYYAATSKRVDQTYEAILARIQIVMVGARRILDTALVSFSRRVLGICMQER